MADQTNIFGETVEAKEPAPVSIKPEQIKWKWNFGAAQMPGQIALETDEDKPNPDDYPY